nr:cytochrome-c peroxidase [Sulfurimonas sp. SAG-AH-194-C20]
MKSLILILTSCVFSLFAGELITPILAPQNINTEKALLGEKLFFDARLSVDDTIACASCHKLDEGGDDNLQFSFGVNGQEGNINAPTVLNAVNNFRQFWDGRAKNLQEQAIGPIENSIEMGFNFPDLISKLQKTEYKKEFKKVYNERVTKENITNAIAEYEKTLVTLNAPFDKYLKGDENAISDKAKEGYALFKTKGCISCHHGVNVGGNLYSKFGVIKNSHTDSLGRYSITKKEKDKYFFKVPSLRNIEHTAPYFHDGRASTLHKAIEIMALLQLGRQFSQDEVMKIEEFLKSLSGEMPKTKDIYVP